MLKSSSLTCHQWWSGRGPLRVSSSMSGLHICERSSGCIDLDGPPSVVPDTLATLCVHSCSQVFAQVPRLYYGRAYSRRMKGHAGFSGLSMRDCDTRCPRPDPSVNTVWGTLLASFDAQFGYSTSWASFRLFLPWWSSMTIATLTQLRRGSSTKEPGRHKNSPSVLDPREGFPRFLVVP